MDWTVHRCFLHQCLLKPKKMYKGKALYNPSGKAGEYSYWACNFYNGCSNNCEYCYCKHGILAKTMGGNTPTLKKCFKDVEDAGNVFAKEVNANIDELRKHGLFFSFSTDPMLPETFELTTWAVWYCIWRDIPVKILTKCTQWVKAEVGMNQWDNAKRQQKLIAYGFTLTGHDELEPGAATNVDRIHNMHILHDAGYRTWASIEPIIDLESSAQMIYMSRDCCDLFKIGLKSGQVVNGEFRQQLQIFVTGINEYGLLHNFKVYWKESITKYVDCTHVTSVPRDYNMFTNGRRR